jgi:hypothetical protein
MPGKAIRHPAAARMAPVWAQGGSGKTVRGVRGFDPHFVGRGK